MRRASWALALLGCLGARSAGAAGFYITDIGTRGMARAGAFVASPDSLLATHYNPAGLSLLKGFHAELSLSMVGYQASYERRCPCVSDPSNPVLAGEDERLMALYEGQVANTGHPLAIPFLSFGYGFDWLDTTVAVAAYGPNSGRHNWSELPPTTSPRYPGEAAKQPWRFRALDVNNLEANFTLGLSFSPLKNVRIGGSAFVFASGSDQGLVLNANFESFTDQAEDPRFDVPVQFQLNTTWALNWGVGAAWDIVDGLTVGTSFRGKRSIRGQGKIQAQLPPLFVGPDGIGGASIEGDDVQIELDVAPVWRTGLQYRLPGLFTAEVAVVYEGWSTHDRIVLRPQGVSFTLDETTVEIPKIVLDRRWQDTWSIRLGGEFERWQPYLGLRAGYFYETSAIPESRVDVARIDRPKHGFSVGLSTQWYGVKVEVAAMYVHLVTADIDDSESLQTAVLTEPLGADTFVTTVGNGRISGRYLIGSLSLSLALDAMDFMPSADF